MAPAHQSDEELLLEMRNQPIDWEAEEERRRMEAAIDYMLSMTVTERVERHYQANLVIERLNAVAAKYGLRALGWSINGPAEKTTVRKHRVHQ